MFNLLKKDFILLSGVSIFIVICAYIDSVIGFILPKANNINIAYTFGIIGIVFILIVSCIEHDGRDKSQVILNSFPIKRSDIVKEKYIILIVFILISSILFFLLTNIIKVVSHKTDGRAIGILDIIVAIDILLIFYSIYFPLFFKFDSNNVFNSILFILVLIAPKILVKVFDRRILDMVESLNSYKVSIVILIFSIAIYCISLQVSKHIYLKREF